jgi:PIN domain nuclease of toxin-antitoxin system
MRLLLDTHTLIWAVEQPSQLSPSVVTALQEPANDLLLSAGTIWEFAIKVVHLPRNSYTPQAVKGLPA